MRINKDQKGVTMIALIITVIVLVILAAVTIQIAYKSGIINHATNGAIDYIQEEAREKNIINNTANIFSNALENNKRY